MEWGQVILHALEPSTFIYLVIGVLVGAFVGAMPGLTAVMALALLTPLSFWLDPRQGFAMLIGVYNSAIWAGGITAILINTPGTPASIATTFDGYEMTKRGEAGLALGINTIYSVLGGLFSTVVLIVAAFPLAKFALTFGPAEFFALAIFGLSMMVSVSGKSILKGLIVGILGLLIATIGLDPMFAFQRFTFGNTALLDGISFIPVMIGLFGIGEVLYQVLDKEETKRTVEANIKNLGRIFPTFQEFKRVLPSCSVSAIISVIIGAVPGTGGDIASIICWDTSRKMSKKPEEYGKGSIEGVANTCLANNATIGGALTTMLTLGIPGDAPTAVLIGSLMVYGLQPGPRLFIEQAGFVKELMIFMVLANIVILIVGLMGSKLLASILKVKQEIIWMTVLLFCLVGSYSLSNSFLDIYIVVISGILGFFFRKMEFPLGPLILGLLLGKFCESNLRRAMAISMGNYDIFLRPISFILIILTVLSLVLPVLAAQKKKRKLSAGNGFW